MRGRTPTHCNKEEPSPECASIIVNQDCPQWFQVAPTAHAQSCQGRPSCTRIWAEPHACWPGRPWWWWGKQTQLQEPALCLLHFLCFALLCFALLALLCLLASLFVCLIAYLLYLALLIHLYIYTFARTYIYIYVYMYIYIYTCFFVGTALRCRRVCGCIYTRQCAKLPTHLLCSKRMYSLRYIYREREQIYTHPHVYTYIYIYMRVYTSIHYPM